MASKIAVVTGSNKGIGFAIVKGLCERFQGNVYLTSRDVTRGQDAVKELNKLGFKPLYHQLDITKPDSITKFRDYIKEKHGGIDVLVNNAAIAFNFAATEPFALQAEETTFVNYFSLVSACNILFPILSAGAKVVNISSSAGHLSRIPGEALRKRLSDKNLTEPQLTKLVKEFVDAAKKGTNVDEGWGNSAYSASKVAVSALTLIQDREYGDKGIIVNCVHPGYVDTDMSSHKGTLTIEQGSEAPLYLALDAPNDVKGVYMWFDKSIVDWYGPPPKTS